VSSIAFTNIATLVTNDSSVGDGALGIVRNATVVSDDGVIVGITTGVPTGVDSVVDCTNKALLPGFCSIHIHTSSLRVIDQKNLHSDPKARNTPQVALHPQLPQLVQLLDSDLASNAQRLLDEALASGTTTMEIKSGYGLTKNDELRSLQVAKRFTEETTLLAAHDHT
jgi:imidazolonepropionase